MTLYEISYDVQNLFESLMLRENDFRDSSPPVARVIEVRVGHPDRIVDARVSIRQFEPYLVRIGLDLDNTLVTYDALFSTVARSRKLLPPDFAGGKRDVRDAVRLLPDGELEWQSLQAHIYGAGILDAAPAPGVRDFIRRAVGQGIGMVVVSHKTEHAAGDPGGVNLRDAARKWLRTSGIVGSGAIPEGSVYFEDTREAKIARIIQLQCTHFIDDLEEVFNDPAFPARVDKLLIAETAPVPSGPFRHFTSFDEITHELFGA